MANRVSSRKLVGRHEELELLAGLLARAAAGEGGAALVTGEAGVGKSRLVAEVARRAREGGALPLVGECVDLAEAELPYAPVVGALRAVVRERTEPELHRLLGSAQPELARLLPELGEPAGAESSGGQARLFELLLGVLSRLGREQPVLLVFEDVHWADAATMDLVGFLVRNQRAERLATVLTLRSDELAPEDPLRQRIAEVERSARALRIDLEPLSRDDVAAQAAEITGAATPAAVAERLYERAQGNPFFTEELLAAGVEGELPASLRDALLARVRRLSDPARDAVGVAAVAGRTVDHRLLATVSRLPERDLVGALRDAVANHVLVSDGLRYAFRHALLRDAVYADLLAGQRAPVHAALAEALAGHPELAEARATSEAEIAHHWNAAGAAEPALAASVRAGAQAERVYAVADARRHYERALELWERVDEPARLAGIPRAELLRRAAEAVWLAGDEPGGGRARPRGAGGAGRRRPTTASPRGCTTGSPTYLWGSGQSEEGLRSARRAIELLPADPPTRRPRRVRWSASAPCSSCAARTPRRLSAARKRSPRRARPARATPRATRTTTSAARCAFLGDEAAAIGAPARRGPRSCARSAPARAGCPEYENLSEVLSDAGRHEEALDVARDGIAAARELGVERSYGVVLRGRAALGAVALGQLEEAERLTDEAFDLGGETFFAFNALEARARCALLRGELAVAERGWRAPVPWPSSSATRCGSGRSRRSARSSSCGAGSRSAPPRSPPLRLPPAPERESPHPHGRAARQRRAAHADRAAAGERPRDPGLGAGGRPRRG